MTGAKLKRWRKQNGYTQSRLCILLGVDVMTISRWERDKVAIPPFLELALQCLEKLVYIQGGEKGTPLLLKPVQIIKGKLLKQNLKPKPKKKRR